MYLTDSLWLQGGPKLLSDYNPPDSQFGGGLGYLVDSETSELLLTTRFVVLISAFYHQFPLDLWGFLHNKMH
jgi:hypothetical protein